MNKLLAEAKRRTARDTASGELKFWLIMLGGTCLVIALCVMISVATVSPS